MKISIVIVNYNVEHFLNQCLNSVFLSLKNIEGEIFVVDNNSVDGSIEMIKRKYPIAKIIQNKENVGFSRANNQAIKISKGEYVLLLNPDTIVEERTFEKIIDFMDKTPNAGGLGVKIIDGKGKFSPESKRGLPMPSVSFYKIFGLSKLFPKSKRFGKYYLSYLSEDEIHEVDVLSGAFMLLRKKVIDKIGLLDEDFFMYGEDIDLSYRITKAGYKNYYFPETRIIHYKGESTKKNSVNYVFVFYNAMIIFAKKHYAKDKQRLFVGLINIAIWFRATLALFARLMRRIIIPLLDIAFVFGGILFIAFLWQKNLFAPSNNFSSLFLFSMMIYTLIWVGTVLLFGGYDRPIKLEKIFKSIILGTAAILIGYSLLPETYRFSRALILLGAIWTFFWYLLSRIIYNTTKFNGLILSGKEQKRIVIVGCKEECARVSAVLEKTNLKIAYKHFVYINNDSSEHNSLHQIDEILNVYKINEVVLCAKNISSEKIINLMSDITAKNIEFKIAPPESHFVIGSNNINHAGDYYIFDVNNIGNVDNRRRKRIFDFSISILLLIFSPFFLLFIRNPFRFYKNSFAVLFGCKTWVGYEKTTIAEFRLPKLKKGVLSPLDFTQKNVDNAKTIANINLMYARDYNLWTDLQIVLNNIKNLGK